MSAVTTIQDLDDGIGGGDQLEQVVPRLGELVSSVGPAELELSTPCEGWTTRDLLNHVVGGARMFADALLGAPVRPISGRLPDVVGDDPAGAFEAAVERFGRSVGEPGALDTILPLPFGAMTGHVFLRFVSFDLAVHTWDLATTLGEDHGLADPLVVDLDRFARHALDGWRRDGINFADRVAAPADASPMERLVAYTGRTPR